MTFLNPRRPKADTAVKQAPEKKRRRRDKLNDTEAQMSRFFTAKRPEKRENIIDTDFKGTTASTMESLARGSGDADRPVRISSLPPVDLPDRPFLGFGSSGATLTSPVKFVQSRRSLRSVSRSSRRSSIGSSSYYSWSTSAPSWKDDHYSQMDMMPAETSHDLYETPQAHTPGPRRPESIPNKEFAIKPQEATNRGLGGKHEIAAEEKPASRSPSADMNTRIEPQEAELSRDLLPGPREPVVQEAHSGGNAQTRSQIPLYKKDRRSSLELNIEPHDHVGGLKSRHDNAARFPYSFDTALEDLLQTCNVSLNRSEDPMATSIGNKPSNHTQIPRSLLGTNERGQNASIIDQTKPFTSDQVNPDGQTCSREFGPRPSALKTTVANAKASPDVPQPESVRNPPPNPKPHISEPQKHSPERPQSGFEPTQLQSSMGWHQIEQEQNHTSFRVIQRSLQSGAWHGYPALYESQVSPNDVAEGNRRYALDAEVKNHQKEQEWFHHHAIDADGAESGFPSELPQGDHLYAQQGFEDSNIDAHDGDSTTYPLYEDFDQHQPLDDNDIDLDVGHRHIHRFSDSGYGRSTIASGEGPRSPISVFGRSDDIPISETRGMGTTFAPNTCGERGSHRWRPAGIDENETYLADFWRPNRLY